MKDIPLIIPNFNQLTYTRNLTNWWQFYYPENPVVIIDNGSDYQPLLDWYRAQDNIQVVKYSNNDFRKNLRHYLDARSPSYYVISDPDIMPHPTTPPNFLEVFKKQVDDGYHHVGFQLIIDDLPSWLYKRDWVIGDEKELRNNKVLINDYEAFKAPIDTTFALYTSRNGGWQSPMSADGWSNSLRMFYAFHLSWYIDGDKLNPEMEHYFSTAKYRIPGEPSSGVNNYRPKKFINE